MDIRYYLRKPFSEYWKYLTVKLINQELTPRLCPITTIYHLSNVERKRFEHLIPVHSEFIIRAAIGLDYNSDNLEPNMVASVAAPGHHAEVIFVLKDLADKENYPLDKVYHTQGFITSQGRFVDRETGLRIAQSAGQVKSKHGSYKQLFSEDMWLLTTESEVFRDHYTKHWTLNIQRIITDLFRRK